MSDKRRKKAIERAQKFAAYEDDMGVTVAERAAFTKQLDALVKKWNITEDELFPPEEEDLPEPERGHSVRDYIPNIPRAKAKPAPKAKPNTGGAIDGAEALDYIGDILGEFFK